jgi:hypothetical protein
MFNFKYIFFTGIQTLEEAKYFSGQFKTHLLVVESKFGYVEPLQVKQLVFKLPSPFINDNNCFFFIFIKFYIFLLIKIT